MEEQQKWFIPSELSEEDIEGVIREIESYIDAHPDEVDDYWLVDFNEEDIFAKSFPKADIDDAADKYQLSPYEIMMDIMRHQNGVTKQ
jgi:hypothetical protein